MKARNVKLDPDGPLGRSLLEILSVRLEELRSFTPAALDPRAAEALHDMRIAVKRVRYILEVAEAAAGSEVKRSLKTMKRLQELLGEIHDCDEMLPVVDAHVEKIRGDDVAATGAAADRTVAVGAVRDAPHRRKYRGLASLAVYVEARRAALHEAFVQEWSALERSRFDRQLKRELAAALARVEAPA